MVPMRVVQLSGMNDTAVTNSRPSTKLVRTGRLLFSPRNSVIAETDSSAPRDWLPRIENVTATMQKTSK